MMTRSIVMAISSDDDFIDWSYIWSVTCIICKLVINIICYMYIMHVGHQFDLLHVLCVLYNLYLKYCLSDVSAVAGRL